MQPRQSPVHVLILGGSYGGLATALNLADLCAGKAPRFGRQNSHPSHKIPVEITIVDERDGYFHLIGAPLAMADEQYAEKNWVRFNDIAALQSPRFRLRHGSVERVDLDAKAAYILPHQGTECEEVRYDYLVAATGLRRAWPSVPQALTRTAYLDEVRPHIGAVSKAEHGVVVVGGGAVGIEMAAELKMICPHIEVSLIHSRDSLLSSEPLPDDFKARTLELLREAGVTPVMGKRLQRVETADSGMKTLHLSDASVITASKVINAVSAPKPTTSYVPHELLNDDGEVRIKPNLAFASAIPNAASHFAIGDLIPQTGVKRCGGAMHHGHYAACNIHQHNLASRGVIEQPQYLELPDHGVNIGLAVGKKAIGYSEQTGIMAGEDTLKYLFGDDLGFKYCWDYLKLGERAQEVDVASHGDALPQPIDAVDVVRESDAAVATQA